MIHLNKLVFNSFQVNTYILHDETKDCLIIDPACYTDTEKAALEGFIKENGLKPVLNIYTHLHIDHTLGMHYVKETFDIESQGHEGGNDNLKRGPLMGEIFGFKTEAFPPLDKYIKDGDTISFGESEIKALHVPGHSPGSLAFYSEKDSFVITGDALFQGSIGRTDLPGGDYDELIESISTKLFTLPEETTVWPGHGPQSSIGDEKKNNPFFR